MELTVIVGPQLMIIFIIDSSAHYFLHNLLERKKEISLLIPLGEIQLDFLLNAFAKALTRQSLLSSKYVYAKVLAYSHL